MTLNILKKEKGIIEIYMEKRRFNADFQLELEVSNYSGIPISRTLNF